MTRAQAIEQLEHCNGCTECDTCFGHDRALQVAILALKNYAGLVGSENDDKMGRVSLAKEMERKIRQAEGRAKTVAIGLVMAREILEVLRGVANE